MRRTRILPLLTLFAACSAEPASGPDTAPDLLAANGVPGGSKCAFVVLSPDSIMLTVGQMYQLSDTVYNKKGIAVLDAPVTWFAASNNIAAVSSMGVATAVSPGVGWVLASCATGAVDSSQVVVVP